jgi:hypothetical protein
MKKSNPYYELFGILKLGRVLRLNKIIAFMNVEEDIKASIKLTKIVFFLLIYIHFYACIWFLIVKSNKTWVSAIHVDKEDRYEFYSYPENLKQYLICIHSSVLICLGTDILPSNTIENIMAACGAFFGAIINANIFGELAVIMS